MQAGVSGVEQGLLRFQEVLELCVGGKSPRGAEELASFGGVPILKQVDALAVERDHFVKGFGVAHVDREFHGGIKANAQGARQPDSVVITVWREVAINGLVVCRNATLVIFLVPGQAEQNTHEFDAGVGIGTPVLCPSGGGGPQQ